MYLTIATRGRILVVVVVAIIRDKLEWSRNATFQAERTYRTVENNSASQSPHLLQKLSLSSPKLLSQYPCLLLFYSLRLGTVVLLFDSSLLLSYRGAPFSLVDQRRHPLRGVRLEVHCCMEERTMVRIRDTIEICFSWPRIFRWLRPGWRLPFSSEFLGCWNCLP